MLILHTDWQRERLLTWAVDPQTQRALSASDLRSQLGEICEDSLLLVEAVSASAGDHEALALAPAQAVDFLQALPSDRLTFAPSTLTWKTLAQFVIDRIAAGQFYPTIEHADGGPSGVWRVLVSGSEELLWLQSVSKRIAVIYGLKNGHSDELVETFLNSTTDLLVRRSFTEDPFFAGMADRCRKPAASADMRFVGSLLTSLRTIEDCGGETLEAIRAWTDSLQETPVTAAFRIVFKLIEPPEGDDEHWQVQLLMEPLNSEMEAIPAARLWEGGQDLPPILGRSLTRQRQSFMEQLTRAAEAWPVLQNRIPDRPSGIDITPAEAVGLIRQWATRLIDAGFGVQFPKWALAQPRELSIQLAVEPVEPDESLFFDPDDVAAARAFRTGDALATGQEHMGLNALLQFDWRVALGTLQLGDDQFRSILQMQKPLVRFNGEWIQVDADAAQRAMDFITAHRTGSMTLAEALRTAHGTSRADTGLQISGLTGADWIGQLLMQSPDAKLQEMQQPETFAGQLRPYQLRGLQWLAFLQRLGIGACLADDMGLGKTIQFISLLLQEREKASAAGRPKPGPTLLFAPTSVLGNWSHEMERFAPSLTLKVHHGALRLHGQEFADMAGDADLVITTYALAGRDAEDFARVKWHRLALDEAQKIKNPSAASTQAIRQIAASYRVALTGTPIENHLSELWSIMEILNPGLLGSAAQFREQFAIPIERVGDRGRAQHLRELIKPFVLRRTKSDPLIAGDLPEKLEMKVFCNLTVEQAGLYQRITDEMLGQIDAASGIRRRGLILAALTRLKQVCDHPALLAGKLPGFNANEGDLDARSGKCERLIEMLEEVLEEGDSALVFTQYKEMGDILQMVLPRRLKSPVLYLHGGTPAAHRDGLIQQFQDPKGQSRIFILSLRAGGLGLNLTRANHVFHFDRWWNPAVEQQATDRAHRIGQSRTVQVHKYVCIGTMEERIDRMITDKMQLADRIITSGDDWLTSLSTEELRRTLELSSNAVEDYSAGGA